jgi:predicted dehydrogenase
MAKQLTGIIVGAGHRGVLYGKYALQAPDRFRIVGVVDPREHRRKAALSQHGLGDEAGFESVEQVCRSGKIADVAINGTMDSLHVPTSIELLKAGYDILLEKPFATSEEQMWDLAAAARKHKRKVLVCHVLRYTPFYNSIRREILSGRIGRIINIQTNEHVSYHHEATAFVRGKWNRQDVGGSGHLMAKCCHDLDLLVWMMGGNRPVTVSSFGDRMFFRTENAPAGSGTRCMKDCSIEPQCPYSAKKIYIEQELWGDYAWEDVEHCDLKDKAFKEEHMRNTSRYGRCVWRCDNTVVDHQSVMVRFADGATATHNMVTGTARPCRTIHILGEKGEIFGVFEDYRYEVRLPDPATAPDRFTHEEHSVVEATGTDGMGGDHGGGDMRLVADFVEHALGGKASIACTSLDTSIYGHLLGFKAEEARLAQKVVDIPTVEA